MAVGVACVLAAGGIATASRDDASESDIVD
jgi:hypothetical protein